MKKLIIFIIICVIIAVAIFFGIKLANNDEVPSIESSGEPVIEKDNSISNNNVSNTSTLNTTNELTQSTVNNTTNNTVTNSQTSNSDTNKDELTKHLEKFALVCYIDSRTKDLEKTIKRNEDYINMAMLTAEEKNITGTPVNGNKAVSKDTINSIISEIKGRKITDVVETGNILYKYDDGTSQYYSVLPENRIGHVLEVKEKNVEDGVLTVKFICCFPTQEQLTSEKFSGLSKYEITMELVENSSYNYSKYRINDYQFVI